MNRIALPEMRCPPLPPFAIDNWDAIQRVFEPLPAWKLRQHWLPTPSPLLRGGTFRAGTWSDALVLHAELIDADIFNPVTEFNEFAFTKGDAFEMFLRPEGQDTYFEFHVTPFNQKLQLRFASAHAFRSLATQPRHTIQHCKVSRPLFDSRTRICPDLGRWSVVAVIPFASVVETKDPVARSQWRFSASRYDYTRGQEKPVLSSTSVHARCDFHRQQEWGILHFLARPLASTPPTQERDERGRAIAR